MSLKRNILAGFLGQGWTAVMGVAFVPLYIRYLGMESYGLIGVFAIMQAWLSLLDMGMTPTLNREMARFTAGAHTPASIRDLLRSLETVCAGIAALIALVVWLLATWLANHWLRTETLPADTVARAITIIGFVVAARFVEGLYKGALQGLQEQVWVNAIGSVMATLRALGAVFVLVEIKSSVDAFFLWQTLISVVTVFVLRWKLYSVLPRSAVAARFSWHQLRTIWRFAGGMMASTLLVLLLMQVDKIVLSRLLTLEQFGYYNFASTTAAVLSLLTIPITQAYYPRFTQLATQQDPAPLTRLYHQAAQMIAVLLVPAALFIVLFSTSLLTLWTGDAALAERTAPLLNLLGLGMMLNGLMGIPYTLTLAYGWPGFAIRQNLVAVMLLIPAVFWVVPRYGAIGAAWVWVLLNAGYLLIAAPYLYRRLLTREMWHWYGCDVGLPFAAAAATGGLLSLAIPTGHGRMVELAAQAGAGLAMGLAALLAAPDLRPSAIHKFQAWRARAWPLSA